MLVNPKSFWLNEIKELVSKNGYQTTIFVSSNVDSICCSAMFSILFNKTTFEIIPVENNNQLFSIMNEKGKNKQEKHIYVLVNCGGIDSIPDSTSFLTTSDSTLEFISTGDPFGINEKDLPRKLVYLLDQHRPINHRNLICPEVRIIGNFDEQKIRELRNYLIEEHVIQEEKKKKRSRTRIRRG